MEKIVQIGPENSKTIKKLDKYIKTLADSNVKTAEMEDLFKEINEIRKNGNSSDIETLNMICNSYDFKKMIATAYKTDPSKICSEKVIITGENAKIQIKEGVYLPNTVVYIVSQDKNEEPNNRRCIIYKADASGKLAKVENSEEQHLPLGSKVALGSVTIRDLENTNIELPGVIVGALKIEDTKNVKVSGLNQCMSETKITKNNNLEFASNPEFD